MIKYCFQSKSVKFNIDLLKYSKSLPLNVKQSKKYIQIKKTLVEVGLIEPIIIYIDGGSNEVKVVDGHLRIEALKELGETEVKCLISTVYDTYTPNSRVNRITIIQEQKMIQQAIKSGVSIEKLSAALDISIDTLKGKITILNGIAPEVISIFSNLNVPKGTLYVLKKMKPMRQIECSNIMVNLDNFSRQFALSLLHSSPIGLLVHGDQKNKSQREGHRKVIDRLEKEMAQVHIETEKIKEIYGANTLKLVIVKSHIKNLLDNPKILHWLLDNKPDLLTELRKISSVNSLN